MDFIKYRKKNKGTNNKKELHSSRRMSYEIEYNTAFIFGSDKIRELYKKGRSFVNVGQNNTQLTRRFEFLIIFSPALFLIILSVT